MRIALNQPQIYSFSPQTKSHACELSDRLYATHVTVRRKETDRSTNRVKPNCSERSKETNTNSQPWFRTSYAAASATERVGAASGRNADGFLNCIVPVEIRAYVSAPVSLGLRLNFLVFL